MFRVSVVIATYDTGEALSGVVAALDAQSLPASDFEVVWVDDGSPGDTVETLRGFASTRPNYVVERIENSGWPGKPRNVGTRLARGDYVFFMDHDDYLFPEALERMVDFADQNELDVVLPKEVVSGWKSPGWTTWRRQLPRVAEFDQSILQCITPHKLYRRQYVLDNEIWFPEGRIRLEDFDYNAQAWSQTDRIGVFADYPCYKWIIHPESSHKGGYNIGVYWESFERSLQPILKHLEPGDRRDHLLVRWYRSRILERLNAQYAGYTDSYREKLKTIFAGLLHYFPSEVDRLLTPADLARSALLRSGDHDSLLALSEADKGLRLHTLETTTAWDDGVLRLRVRGMLAGSNGAPVKFRRGPGDAISRVLPDKLADSAAEGLDVSKHVEDMIGEFAIRSRTTDVDWTLPSTAVIEYSNAGGGLLQLSFTIDGTLDPRTVQGGRPLDPQVWDVFYRVDRIGWANTTWVKITEQQLGTPTALVDGLGLVLYRTTSGNLAIDAADEVRTLVAVASPRLSKARIEIDPNGGLAHTHIPLRHTHISGATTLVGTATVDGHGAVARLVSDGDRATLVIETGGLDAAKSVTVKLHGKTSPALFEREFSARDAARAAAAAAMASARDAAAAARAKQLPERVRALLRRRSR